MPHDRSVRLRCEPLGLRAVGAETDADTVDFYRAIGFAVEILSEQYPAAVQRRVQVASDRSARVFWDTGCERRSPGSDVPR